MKLYARLNRLRNIADSIKSEKPLSDADRGFITQALNDIADGKDPKDALNVKARRGERRSKESQQKTINKQLAMGWIAAARTPVDEGGLGLTYDEAIGEIGENVLHAFGLTEETLKTYWNKNPALRQQIFKLPD